MFTSQAFLPLRGNIVTSLFVFTSILVEEVHQSHLAHDNSIKSFLDIYVMKKMNFL